MYAGQGVSGNIDRTRARAFLAGTMGPLAGIKINTPPTMPKAGCGH
jgi:hypothetical protein